MRAKGCSRIDVLLLDAQYRQALTCMRIYAQAGLEVGAVACAADAASAPSFRSRWCALRATVPDFATDVDAYIDGIMKLIDDNGAQVIVPAHDGSIAALRTRRAELERRVALPLADEQALDVAVSKVRTQALATTLGIAVPRSVRVAGGADVEPAMRELGCPVVVKPDESWANRNGIGTRLSSAVARDASEAREIVDFVLSAGGLVTFQEWVPGRREAVSLLYARERFWARFAQLSYREWPVLGGASVLCESIPLRADITTAAERLVQTIGLEGCSMVEFRRNRDGRPVLMEINPRMAGSVALAVSCGVNFPRLVLDWSLRRPLHEQATYRIGRRLRWLAGDIWNLKGAFDSQGHPDVPPRGRAVATFLADFVHRPSHLDMVAARDMVPALVEMREIVLQHVWCRARKTPPMRWLISSGKV